MMDTGHLGFKKRKTFYEEVISMKKVYEELEMEFVILCDEDVLRTSDGTETTDNNSSGGIELPDDEW